ncbi:hypothetical protein MPER_09568, partial [Moniliophthora perniciosa FA553]
FYVECFVIRLIVPSTNDQLFVATRAKTGAAASPFVVATTLVGIKVLNHVINGAILLFVMSAANSDLYIGSRTLYGLAAEGKAPRIFKRVNSMGVPYASLILCTMFCGLVFLNTASSGAKVFTWFVNLVSTFGAITWMCFDTFIPWTTDDFITSYIAIPVFIVLFIGYKLAKKTRMYKPEEVDLVTGLREIDEEEMKFEEKRRSKLEAMGKRSLGRRIWDSI